MTAIPGAPADPDRIPITALLLAGGALAVRVAVVAAAAPGRVEHGWLYTAAALVLAGVALVLIALPKIAPSAEEADEPEPPPPRG